MKKDLLQIEGLEVSVAEKKILHGITLSIVPGSIHAIMGPNGSGKSTLGYTIVGHPQYRLDSGKITLKGKLMNGLSPDVRAREGIFLSFQYPRTIPGVTVSNFLRMAYRAVKKKDVRVFAFEKMLREKMELLQMPENFSERFVNDGFSGGEKKKLEVLQALVLEPALIIMDETDSGLDVDALKIVAEGAKKLLNPKSSILLITHYSRILEYLNPDFVHIMKDGQIVNSGGGALARKIEAKGFEMAEAPRLTQKNSPLVLID